MDLETKIQSQEARLAVVGLGYVGLPIAVEFAKSGLRVVGLDVDEERIAALARGESPIPDVSSAELREMLGQGTLAFTREYGALAEADVVFICVPTPFTANKAPDLSYVVAAARGIAPHLRPGQLVVLQSTSHPGTTEDVVVPILEESGLKAGRDFHVAFSPERVNPGDRLFGVRNTPKVVGGLTPRCAALTSLLYGQLPAEVRLVSSPRAAEMTKLLENVFRSINIALVNELAQLSERMGIDFWEVIEAASSKPFGFMPFYPGPGVGGHCIPVDPYYLSWKAREYDFFTKFIELAAEVNESMPYHVYTKVGEALNEQGKPLWGASVLILGVAFKKDINDARNAPAIRLIELLLKAGCDVRYNDPYIPTLAVGGDAFRPEPLRLASVLLTEAELAASDVVVIVAPHSLFDYAQIVRLAKRVVDTTNATKGVTVGREKILRLGAPR